MAYGASAELENFATCPHDQVQLKRANSINLLPSD
jgi:hypothetical protein